MTDENDDNSSHGLKARRAKNVKLVAHSAVLLTCHFVLRKLYTEPFIGASYQISINLVK